MCGHVGIAGKLAYKDEGTFKKLLLLDYFRGTDSTGAAVLRMTNEPMIAKLASHPIDLFDSKQFEKALSGYCSKVFLGHNRAATKGKVNGNNAHPYQYGHIVGAHNGTLEKSSWDALNKVLGYETDVDSMAIFACIEKIGIEETVKLLQGAWALVWMDLEEGTLNFLRNKERPMWYCYDKDFKQLFWASEWPMLQAATEMGDYELYYTSKQHCFFPMDVDRIYTYDIDKLNSGGYKNVPDPVGKKLEGKAPLPVVKYNQGTNPFTGGAGTTTQTTTTRKGGFTPSGNSQQTLTHITIITPVGKPWGTFLDEDEFKALSNGKCMYCSEPVHFTDEGVVVFESLEEVLCGECSGHSTSRYMATPQSFNDHLNSTNTKEKVQ